MTTEQLQPQPRTVTLTMDADAVPVPGNRGDQWKLAVKLFGSDFASFLWIDRTVEPRQPLEGEAYPCAVSVRKLKAQPKDGSIRTGASDWDWQWKIDRWNIDDAVEAADPPVSPRPSGQVKDNSSPEEWSRSKPAVTRAPAAAQPPTWEEQPMKPDHPSKRRSIERQASLKAAIDYLQDKESAGDLLEVASLFYEWISAPPEAAQVPPEAPESPGGPVTKGIADQAAMAIVQGGPAEVSGETLAYDNDGNPEPVTPALPRAAVASDSDFQQFWKWVAEVHPVRKDGNTPADEVADALGRPLDQWLDGKLRTIGAAAERCKLNWDSK